MTGKHRHPLLAAICALVEDRCLVVLHREVPWASVTFSGSRHEIELQFNGDEDIAMGETLIAMLPEHEFSIDRKVVVDALVLWTEMRTYPANALGVKFELLVLDDD